VRVEGFVLAPDGVPASGAVVVSSAGGQVVTEDDGRYRLELLAPASATSLWITAFGPEGRHETASASIALPPASDPVAVAPLLLTESASCPPEWLPTFGEFPGANGTVRAFVTFDDGGGPALYAAGEFHSAGAASSRAIAKWDGAHWSSLGTGVRALYTPDTVVFALAVFDDGTGPALYAGGWFQEADGDPVGNLARWDGSAWTSVRGGTGNSGAVYAMTVFDDGTGKALYVGGDFQSTGGHLVNKIAKWNGSSWADLGGGVGSSGVVSALTAFDDGNGSALYAGGSFTSIGGVPATRVARWDGTSWSALGGGVNGIVLSLTAFDDGSGPVLHAAGRFTTADGDPANRVARWTGESWKPLGDGLGQGVDSVWAIRAFDDGTGPALYAVGDFRTAGGLPADRIARWDGLAWSSVGEGLDAETNALAVYDDGRGPALYAGGRFERAGDRVLERVGRWDGSSWSPLGRGFDGGVSALVAFDEGAGPALYAGGIFSTVDGVLAEHVASWDGSRWTPLGRGLSSTGFGGVSCLAIFDDGSGPALYAGGSFTTSGNTTLNRIARWDGSSWGGLGSGMNSTVDALAVYDDGGGSALYAAGSFTTSDGMVTNRIARWDGSGWSALGGGIDPSSVRALAVWDDGRGPALYAGGTFTTAGGVAADDIAMWDGSTWSPVGGGVSGVGSVSALAVYDDGRGSALYVGGSFFTVGSVTASHIARWDGVHWEALGAGLNGSVYGMAAFDDGTGPALFVAGNFSTAGGVAAEGIARWGGASWASLGGGIVASLISGMAVYDDGRGEVLFVGGSCPESGDTSLAKWGCRDALPVLSCPSEVVAIDPPGSAPGELVTFTVTATDDQDPTPTVVCLPPSGSFFPPGTTTVQCTATDDSGHQATCSFPVHVRPGRADAGPRRGEQP